MKRLITMTAGVALAVLCIAPAAHASTACTGGGSAYTRGGYEIAFDRYRALNNGEASEVTRRMNCASVRFAASAVRRKVAAKHGYPRLPGMFWDGYVSWDCYRASGYNVQCVEYESGTGFQFRARVYRDA